MNPNLADRFIPDTRKASRLYGCYTNDFARTWRSRFLVTETEGPSLIFDTARKASPFVMTHERSGIAFRV